MRFLITAGPTREHLDDVRFLSNASSGRMGYEIARAAARAGHEVDLVSGPTALRAPKGVRVTRVTSTQEMYDAVARRFAKADVLIGAAAPADYTPEQRAPGKAKKSATGVTLRLKPTIDILATLGARKRGQIIIAFALEVQAPLRNALRKLERKNADAILLNSPAAMGATRSTARIILRDRSELLLENTTKARIGSALVRLATMLKDASAHG